MHTELPHALRPAEPEKAASFVQHLANSPSRQKALHQEIRLKGMVPVADILAFHPQTDHYEYGGCEANQAPMARVVKLQVGWLKITQKSTIEPKKTIAKPLYPTVATITKLRVHPVSFF